MTIRLDTHLYKRIEQPAEREKRSRTGQIEMLLERALGTPADRRREGADAADAS